MIFRIFEPCIHQVKEKTPSDLQGSETKDSLNGLSFSVHMKNGSYGLSPSICDAEVVIILRNLVRFY